MEKSKRTLALCGIFAAFCLGSCITTTDELDLNKEISLDMQIGPGGLSIPIGSLSKIYLDSLIKTGGDESVLQTLEDGRYGFSMDGEIDEVEVSIGEVSFTIDKPDVDDLATDFQNPEPGDVLIPDNENETTISIGKVDISGVNKSLPKLQNKFDTDEYDVDGTPTPVHVDLPPIVIDEQSVECGFNYRMPSDVSKLNYIYFGKDKNKGQKMTINVDLKGIFNVLSNPSVRVTAMDITFPENFVLGKDNDNNGLTRYISTSAVSVNNNKFSIRMSSGSVQGLSSGASVLPITMYVKNARFSDNKYYPEADSIAFEGEIKYSLTLDISGTASSTTTKKFKVGISMNEQLEMSDIDVNTNAKEIDLDNDTLTSSCTVDGLDGITKVDYITFKNGSSIDLSISQLSINPFEFDDAHTTIDLVFPDHFVFKKDCKDEQGNTVGTWDNSSNKLTLDLAKAFGKKVSLGVTRLNCGTFDVDLSTASMVITNDVTYSGHAKVNGAIGLGLEQLDALGDKTVKITVSGEFHIDNAEVETGMLSTDFASVTDVPDVETEVDEALVAIHRIDLKNPASVLVNLHFRGMPSGVKELNFSRFTVEFPDFIRLNYNNPNDTRVKVNGNKLIIHGALKPSELTEYGEGFTIHGLSIDTLAFKDPLKIKDGLLSLKGYKVNINGSVTVDNQKIQSNQLKQIVVEPTVQFSPIVVKSVTGKVNPIIDHIHQGVGIAMGDDADFFKNENNDLNLSDPQITIKLVSSVTVPITLDMSLTAKTSRSRVEVSPDDGPISIPACPVGVDRDTTTLIIVKHRKPDPETDNTVYVVMSHLSELMRTVPDSIVFDLDASVDQNVDEHYVDLTNPLAVSGSYAVTIPLSFDDLYLEYSDTIKDLSKDLEDIADMIGDVNVELVADSVVNTIPLGISLSAKALDKNGDSISSVSIAKFEIKAGNEQGSVSQMKLGVALKKGGLEQLDALVFTAACQSNDDNEDSSIRKGQYLHIKNIKLMFPEGIKVDLTDTSKKDGDKNKNKK